MDITKCFANHHHLVLDCLVDDVISIYKKLTQRHPTKWLDDKLGPHPLFLHIKFKWRA
jgi:hypothetical protein